LHYPGLVEEIVADKLSFCFEAHARGKFAHAPVYLGASLVCRSGGDLLRC